MQSHNRNTSPIKSKLILVVWALVTVLTTVGCRNNPQLPVLLGGSAPFSPEVVNPGVVNPGGIPNIGNTCYMNAVLQIFKSLYPDAFSDKLVKDPADPVAKAGQAIMDKIRDDKEPANREEAQAFLTALQKAIAWPEGNKQQCAVELLYNLIIHLGLDVFHNTDLKLPGVHVLPPKELQTMSELVVSGIFHLLDPQSAKFLDHSHNTLIICICRNNSGKKDTSPIENVHKLDVTIGDKSSNYQLAGAIYHDGSAGGGHYVSYIRGSDQWTKYSDAKVSRVEEREVQKATERAYIYFYQLKQ